MFIFHEDGPERGDCTRPYRLSFKKEYTVKEFIYDVFRHHPDDWGYIGIEDSDSDDIDNKIYGNPRCEYYRGKLKDRYSKEFRSILDKKIVSGRADGGWCRMDYILTIE